MTSTPTTPITPTVTSPPSVDQAIELYEAKPCPVSLDAINSLIHHYLVHHCYSNTASVFGAALSTSNTTATNSSTINTDRMMTPLPLAPSTSNEMDIDDDNNTLTTHAKQEQPESSSTPNIHAIQQPPAFDRLGTSEDMDTSDLPPVTPSTNNTRINNAGALKTLDTRKHVRDLILSGNISDVIQYLNASFPSLLDGKNSKSLDMLFMLQCQQFIEFVRSSAPDALRFAQEELGKFGYVDSKYLDPLQDIVALIAYADASQSPVAHYLSQDRREQVAMNLNNYILSMDHQPSETCLERMVKQATVVREVLCSEGSKDKKSTKPVFPRWSLSAFLESGSGNNS